MYKLKQLYNYARFGWFNKAVRDYVDQGLGIEARAIRAGKYWSKHLEFSKDFIRNSLTSLPPASSLSVLGAGRLNDFPLDIVTYYQQVNLVDADPTCQSVWRGKLELKKANFIIQDITGIINLWTEATEQYLKIKGANTTQAEIVEFIRSLVLDEDLAFQQTSDIAISLNLLSQIPIYWRDRVANLLLKYCRIDSDNNGKYFDALQKALNESYLKLQHFHINQLRKITKIGIILITDLNFHYYQKSHSHWITENALYLDLDSLFKDNKLINHDSWFWHISPQDIEQKGYGVIHEVQAKSFLNGFR